MKLQPDVRPSTRAITARGPGYVTVGVERLTRTFLLTPATLDDTWGPERFEDLTEGHFAGLAALAVREIDIALLGTGARQRFPAPALLRPLIEAGRSIEVMDTPAACRTWNILVAEGRRVAAAIIVE